MIKLGNANFTISCQAQDQAQALDLGLGLGLDLDLVLGLGLRLPQPQAYLPICHSLEFFQGMRQVTMFVVILIFFEKFSSISDKNIRGTHIIFSTLSISKDCAHIKHPRIHLKMGLLEGNPPLTIKISFLLPTNDS